MIKFFDFYRDRKSFL